MRKGEGRKRVGSIARVERRGAESGMREGKSEGAAGKAEGRKG